MKRFLLIAFMGAGLSATAQQQPFIKKLPASIDTTGQRFGLIQQRGLLPQATFSHNTSKGKIYALPIDNMPCLVPDMSRVSRMPGAYAYPEGRMPNLFPKQRVIPEKEKKPKE
jgi:hypothetical protein